jgi:hypothetical protein
MLNLPSEHLEKSSAVLRYRRFERARTFANKGGTTDHSHPSFKQDLGVFLYSKN